MPVSDAYLKKKMNASPLKGVLETDPAKADAWYKSITGQDVDGQPAQTGQAAQGRDPRGGQQNVQGQGRGPGPASKLPGLAQQGGAAAMQGSAQMPMPPNADHHTQDLVNMHNRIAASGKMASPQDMALMYWKGVAARAAKMQNMQMMDDQARMSMQMHIDQLWDRASGKGPEAERAQGQLMQLGQIKPPPLDVTLYNDMSTDEKQTYRHKIEGYETEQDKAQRSQGIADHLIAQGITSDPEVAMKIGDALAHGNSIPPELRSQMHVSAVQSLQGLQYMGQLQDMGYGGADLQKAMDAAGYGGIANSIPTGLKSLRQQELEINSKRYDLEKQELDVRLDMAKKADLAAETAAKKEAALEAKDRFLALGEMEKAHKGTVTPQMWEEARKNWMESTGWDAHKTRTVWDRILGREENTGEYEYTPKRGTKEDEDVIKQSAGGQGGQAQSGRPGGMKPVQGFDATMSAIGTMGSALGGIARGMLGAAGARSKAREDRGSL